MSVVTVGNPSSPALDELVSQLATRVRDGVFKVVYDRNTTLFLCGASLQEPDSRRAQIARELSEGHFRKQYELVFPEKLFDELLQDDLLELENQLANSVDVVILVLESPGAFAELGAFANHERLRNKLLCIQNARYRKSKSFINRGPIRHLRKNKAGHTLFVDWNKIPNEIPKIRKWINVIRLATKKKIKADNVIHSHHFILPCIFLMEPVRRSTLERMIQYAANTDEKSARTATAAALSRLLDQREIVRVPNVRRHNRELGLRINVGTTHVYRLTQTGIQLFQSGRYRYHRRRVVKPSVMDDLRLMVLKWQRRNEDITL